MPRRAVPALAMTPYPRQSELVIGANTIPPAQIRFRNIDAEQHVQNLAGERAAGQNAQTRRTT